jgi:GntR family transcriptional regulator, transcriptional repressor for pyruvate dehydrogenase complex
MTQLRRTSLADSVVDALIDLIVERALAPGSAIPSVGELATRFGVSVVVVREAVATLCGRGILERRQGREAIVRRPDPGVVSSMLRMQVRFDDVGLAELQQCRAALEMQSVVFAARQPDKDRDTTAMFAALRQMEQATSVLELRDADILFHSALVAIAGNKALVLLVQALHAVAVDSLDMIYSRLLSDGVPVAELTLGSHEPIAVAVRDGDVAGAIKAMSRHFELSLPDIDYGILSTPQGAGPTKAG